MLHIRDAHAGRDERCRELRHVVHHDVRRPLLDDLEQVVQARLQLDPDEELREDERANLRRRERGSDLSNTPRQRLHGVHGQPDAERRKAFRLRFARDRVRPTRTPHRAPPRSGRARAAASADSDLPTVYRSAAHAWPQATRARPGVRRPRAHARVIGYRRRRSVARSRNAVARRRGLRRVRQQHVPYRNAEVVICIPSRARVGAGPDLSHNSPALCSSCSSSASE